ncbi:MAG: hypothetical protein WCV55_01955 [Candidatus Paceibacterota bacterium]
MALDQKDFIEESLKANAEKAKGLSVADLTDVNSLVNKAPELEKREPTPLPAAKPQFDNEGYPELTTMRTYHGDVASAVREGGLSMIKIAAKEQARRRPIEENVEEKPEHEPNTHMILAIAASALFVVGIGAVIFAFISKSQPAVVIQTPIKKDIISTDSSITLDITGLSSREVQNNIENFIVPNKNNDSLIKINLTNQVGGIKTDLSVIDLLSVIGTNVPDILNRSLILNKFMLGIWSGADQAEPFLIMETSSQETAFPGMLEWEKTMAYDLEPIIGPETILPGNTFIDQTILNHDARALSNGTKIIFFYTIVNGRIIIIAKSEATLGRILDKIRASIILN